MHDVFICHASEDKDDLARPLAEALRSEYFDVWYDEFSLEVGDSLREAIDRGLASSRYGVVVLSPNFFQKPWARRELNGLTARALSEDRRLLLPVWHNIGYEEVLRQSPPLADVFAISSRSGIPNIVSTLQKTLRPLESPLVVARNFLVQMGVSAPSVTDGWWLELIETKEAHFRYPDLNDCWRWIFPLPHPQERDNNQKGLNIAQTALQLDWASDAEDLDITQITPPERVHEFLRKWPGLLECAESNPGTLAMYAPQLTIPGFDDGLELVFDELMHPENPNAYQSPGYGGGPETIDGTPPLCGELVAWRHPSLGNYQNKALAYSFVRAHDFSYSRQAVSDLGCLAWLLSDASNWLPGKIRDALLNGMRDSTYWWTSEMWGSSDVLSHAFFDKTRSKFRYTRSVRAAITDLFEKEMTRFVSTNSAAEICERFISRDFVDAHFEEQERIRHIRSRRKPDAG